MLAFRNPSGGIVDLLAEDILPLISKFKAQTLNSTAQKLQQSLNQVSESFSAALILQKQQLSHIQAPLQDFSKVSESFLGAYKQQLPKTSIEHPQVKTHLKLERNNDSLDILVQEGSIRDTAINFDDLKKVKKVKLVINNDELNDDDINTIFRIWKSMKDITSFELICNANDITDEVLLGLIYSYLVEC